MSPTEYQAKRRALGYTQAGLAEALGVSRETIVRREAGDPRNPIGQEAALALAALDRLRSIAGEAPQGDSWPLGGQIGGEPRGSPTPQ